MFLQNELSVSERVQLSFGVRFDQVEFEITDRYFADGRDDSGSKTVRRHEPDGRPRRRAHRRLELLHDVLERVRDADDDGVQPPGRPRRLQPGARAADSRRNFEVGLRGALGDAQRYEVAVFTIDVEDELIGREIPTSPGRNLLRERRRDEPRGRRVLVDRESHRSHRDHGQLHVLGLQVRRNSSRTIGAGQHRSQRQRDPRHGREPAVRRVRVSRAARLVRGGRRAVRRRAIRRQRQHRRDRRLHADELALRLRRRARQRVVVCRRSSASTT